MKLRQLKGINIDVKLLNKKKEKVLIEVNNKISIDEAKESL